MGTGRKEDSAYLMKCRADLDGKWEEVTPGFCEMLGYSEEELKELTFAEVTHPEDRQESLKLAEKMKRGDLREFETEKRYLKKSGEAVPVYVSGALIRDTEGNPEYVICNVHDLSEKKKTRKKLQESEQRFESLFKHNPNPVYYFDLEGNFVGVNDKLVEFTGYNREDLLQMNFERFIAEEDLERTKKQFVKAASGKSGDYEIKVIVKDGVEKDIRVTKFPKYTGDEITGVFGILQDITEQKKRKKKLQESEEQFRSLFKHNPYPVMYFDLKGRFMGANEKVLEMSGYSREEIMVMDFSSFVPEESLDRVTDHFKKAASGEPQHYEITAQTKKGFIDVEATLSPIYVQGEITGIFCITKDVTEEKRAKRALEKSEQRFKSLFERNPNAVYSFDEEGNFVRANKALEELTGYTIEELREMNFEPLTAPEDRERVWKKFRKAAQGEPQNYEASGFHKDGYRYRVQITNLPIYVDGKIDGVFGIAHDITEEREAQQRVKESEERWQRLVEQNPQPVQIVQDGKIVFINQVGAEYYGASSPEELIGKSILDFSHPDYRDKLLGRKRKLEQFEEVEPDEHKIVLLDGEERYIEAHSIPIQYKGENAIQTVIHDITDLKEKHQIVDQSLREKETLLQEIHHRVKNNLAVISGLLELQAMNTTDDSTLHALRDSQLRIYSMAMIHEKLYQSESLHNIGFDRYLKELVETINNTHDSYKGEVETKFELDEVSLDINQAIPCSLIVNEVIVNCYKHAFSQHDEGEILISLEYNDPELVLEIMDNGVGLSKNFQIEEQQSLGMTLIQTLSRQLNGRVHFDTGSQGEGTRFHLHFEKSSTKLN